MMTDRQTNLIDHLWANRATLADQTGKSTAFVADTLLALHDRLGLDRPPLPEIEGRWLDVAGDRKRFGPIVTAGATTEDDRVDDNYHWVMFPNGMHDENNLRYTIFRRSPGWRLFFVAMDDLLEHPESWAGRTWARYVADATEAEDLREAFARDED
jgi:hypothetical protein